MIHWGKCFILTFLSILQYVDEKDIFFIYKNRPNCLLWKIKEKICSKNSPRHPLLGPDLFNTCIRATLEGWNALTKKVRKTFLPYYCRHARGFVQNSTFNKENDSTRLHFCARTKSRNHVSQSSTTEYWAILVLQCAIELYIEWWSTTQETQLGFNWNVNIKWACVL